MHLYHLGHANFHETTLPNAFVKLKIDTKNCLFLKVFWSNYFVLSEAFGNVFFHENLLAC